MRNDTGKALSRQAYRGSFTETVRMLVSVQRGESERTDYDSRSTWDRFLDAGSIPARSISGVLAQLGARNIRIVEATGSKYRILHYKKFC